MASMRPMRLVAGALAGGVLVLTFAGLLAGAVGEPVSNLTRDAVAVADLPWYTGSVSLFTGMVWAVASALSYFVAWAMPPVRRQMLALGVFAMWLAADDSMLIHDQIGPGHGVPEALFGPIYLVLALVVLRELLRSRSRVTTIVFALGTALLGMSEAFDVVFHNSSFILEDGAKLLGALVWATIPVITYAQATHKQQAGARTQAKDASADDIEIDVRDRAFRAL
jgi:hypothetical protein